MTEVSYIEVDERERSIRSSSRRAIALVESAAK